MWLGMVAAAAGQLAWIPVEPITWLAGLLAAYIAEVAHWFAAPRWAQVELGVPGAAALLASYAALGAALAVGLRAAERRRGVRSLGRRADARPKPGRPSPRLVAAVALAITCLLAGPRLASLRAGADHGSPAAGLRIVVLDVGQGDSILLAPRRRRPGARRRRARRRRISPSMLEQRGNRPARRADHHPPRQRSRRRGGCGARLARRLTTCCSRDRPAPSLRRRARRASRPGGSSAGGVLRSGRPAPARALAAAGRRARPRPPPPSRTCARSSSWRAGGRFRMLSPATPRPSSRRSIPGAVDVLKVAHHGSEDAGLARSARPSPRPSSR